MSQCVFCKISAIKDRVVFKNDYFLVILTNIPIVPGHLLIVPIRHVQKFDELTQKEQKNFFEILPKLRKFLASFFKASGFNFAWNEGLSAGQNIGHLHLHMLPRKAGDTGITKYDPRKFLYRPGSRKVSPTAELKSLAKVLKVGIRKYD